LEKGKNRKMELNRKPFQGVYNIIRFNWHFYLLAGLFAVVLSLVSLYLPVHFQPYLWGFTTLFIFTTVISLIVSFYVYDVSPLYHLKCLPNSNNKNILNINAGFDETSNIIKKKYPNCNLKICDFYNPQQHTEISIKRARKAYPPVKGTLQVNTNKLPFSNNTFDFVLAILSAHEIRNEKERIDFFKEMNRVIKNNGHIYVTEHLRDLSNFMAYTIGFFHFHSKKSWSKTFQQAGLVVKKEIKTTPFITTFVLENGDSL